MYYVYYRYILPDMYNWQRSEKKGIIETQLMTGRSDRDPTIRLSSSQPHPMELGQALGLPDVPGS